MKKLNLDESWDLCLKQWKWLVQRIKSKKSLKTTLGPLDVSILKKEWIKKHGYKNVYFSCFFCEYSRTHGEESFYLFPRPWCGKCPGKKIDPRFNCLNIFYTFDKQPLKFYEKLKELNKIRKAKKRKR